MKEMSTTPRILLLSRFLFFAYFVFYSLSLIQGWFPADTLTVHWFVYLIGVYVLSEKIYIAFLGRGVDVVYAFPVVFVAYMVNFASMLLKGQENFPFLNRAEHFITFILAAYIVWQFFLRYLPEQVWNDHPYYTSILVLAITALAGVLNETIELFMDNSFGTQTIGPGFDTSIDLVMNLLGAGFFLSLQLIAHEADKSGIFKKRV